MSQPSAIRRYAQFGPVETARGVSWSGALIAPRPLFIESGENDHLNGNVGRIQNVYSQVAIARNAYAALDAEKKLRHSVHEGGHEWRALDFYDFLSQSFPATI